LLLPTAAHITYKAAAVQFTTVGNLSATSEQNNRASLQAFDSLAADARRAGVQVVVFPEAVLWHWGLHQPGPQPKTARDAIAAGYAEPLPLIGSNPCNEPSSSNAQLSRRLSCIAKRHNIILVANPIDIVPCNATPCPSDGHFLLNTAVAFDEQGFFVAKYHKRHNGGTYPILDEPNGPAEVSSFVSSFGVRFGLFICYDMDFAEPATALYDMGVRDFLFPTFWDNEPPFQTAAASQQGWSRTWGVNLVAANSGDSPASAGGGLFASGSVVVALFDPFGQNIQKMLVGDLTTPPVQGRAASQGEAPGEAHAPDSPGSAQDGQSFPCQVATINKIVTNRTLATGRCVWAGANGTSVVQAGEVRCQLNATIQQHTQYASRAYLLWASDGALSYIGCPDAERLQACALLACARGNGDADNKKQNATFVCSRAPNDNELGPHVENFVLYGQFAQKTEVLPIVNLLPFISDNKSHDHGGSAAAALLLEANRVQFMSSSNGASTLASAMLKPHTENIAGAVLYGLRDPD